MTPTPEEIKDRVAVKHGFKEWNNLIHYYFDKYSVSESEKDFLEVIKEYKQIENEAMRDYAEALYTERIEKAGSELPSQQLINDWCLNESGNSPITSDFGKKVIDLINRIEYTGMYKATNWMKQAASVVIAKEREKYPKLVFDEKGMLISGECLKRDLVLFEYESDKFITQEQFEGKKHFISGYNRAFEHLGELLSKKDKEIEELKEDVIKFKVWCHKNEFEIDSREEKAHTNEELYHYYKQYKNKP